MALRALHICWISNICFISKHGLLCYNLYMKSRFSIALAAIAIILAVIVFVKVDKTLWTARAENSFGLEYMDHDAGCAHRHPNMPVCSFCSPPSCPPKSGHF